MDFRNTKVTVDIVLNIALRLAILILIGAVVYKMLSSLLFNLQYESGMETFELFALGLAILSTVAFILLPTTIGGILLSVQYVVVFSIVVLGIRM